MGWIRVRHIFPQFNIDVYFEFFPRTSKSQPHLGLRPCSPTLFLVYVMLYHTTPILFWRFPRNYPYPLKRPCDACLWVENSVFELFWTVIGMYRLKESSYVGSFQRYRSQQGGLGNEYISICIHCFGTPWKISSVRFIIKLSQITDLPARSFTLLIRTSTGPMKTGRAR